MVIAGPNTRLIKMTSGLNSWLGHNDGNNGFFDYNSLGEQLANNSYRFVTSGTGESFVVSMKDNRIVVKAGTNVLIDYTDPSPIKSGGVGLFAGCTATFKNVSLTYEKVIVRPFSEAVLDLQWRNDARHVCVIVDTDVDTSFLNNSTVKSNFLRNKVYIESWGSSSNQSSYQNYYNSLGNDGKGVPYGQFCSQNSGVDSAAAHLAGYIKRIIE